MFDIFTPRCLGDRHSSRSRFRLQSQPHKLQFQVEALSLHLLKTVRTNLLTNLKVTRVSLDNADILLISTGLYHLQVKGHPSFICSYHWTQGVLLLQAVCEHVVRPWSLRWFLNMSLVTPNSSSVGGGHYVARMSFVPVVSLVVEWGRFETWMQTQVLYVSSKSIYSSSLVPTGSVCALGVQWQAELTMGPIVFDNEPLHV